MARTPTTGSSPPAPASAPSARPSKAAAKRSGNSKTLSAAATPASTQTTNPSPETAKRRRLDWEAIERDYRTGKFTKAELCRKYDLQPAVLSRQIKRDQALDQGRWQTDLTEVVRQATNARLMAELVKEQVNEGQDQVKETVQIAAEVNSQIIQGHRQNIKAALSVVQDLTAEVAEQRLLARDKELLAQILAGDATDIRAINDAQRLVAKALGTGSRASTLKSLAEALDKLIRLQRQAFAIDTAPPAPPPPPDLSAIPPEQRQEAYLRLVSGL